MSPTRPCLPSDCEHSTPSPVAYALCLSIFYSKSPAIRFTVDYALHERIYDTSRTKIDHVSKQKG
ncbi:hypothetical protein RR46_03677 [Papilio xuthus]|uniref:Uncharacterized protein n=1 Tax=Papilio xuthus TaxID=66420 RepID=A0A194Q538_PAPXU|nr:hypothetical protein RR46_03677 [Papilio xuthus]